MTAAPGADEQRIRQLLIARGVGPDAATAPRPAPAAPRGDDGWWDHLYGDAADTHTPTARTLPGRARLAGGRLPDWRMGETTDLSAPDLEPAEEEKDVPEQPPADRPVEAPGGDWTEATDPDDPVERPPHQPANPARAAGRRATAAYLAIAPRTRVLLYNGTAAGAGWALGLEPLLQGWITQCGHDTGHISAALILGIGMAALIGHQLDRRTRGWWPPLAWACRIPLASALLALGLYAPGTV